MKPWINLPFLIQPEKLCFLESTLKALVDWQIEDMRILVFMNEYDKGLVDHIWSFGKQIEVEIVSVANPMMLIWEHKKYLSEFLESDYTHFLYTDGDIEIPRKVFDYWLETRRIFVGIGFGFEYFIPGTFRIETYQGVDYASDLTFRTDIDSLKIVYVGGKPFFIPQEPFQGISIMDKELAREHIDSIYFSPMMDQSIYKFGFGETCISGYILHNVPEGFNHRVLVPLDDYERCWVYHLPANYAANPNSEHGKIPAHEVFKIIKERIK